MGEFDDQRMRWDMLDPLVLSGAKLAFIVAVRTATGIGLSEAHDLLHRRYDVLRRERPQDFTKSHDVYWADFYS